MLAIKDDQSNFDVEMVMLSAAKSQYYLAYGMGLKLFFVIFTMSCFQIKLNLTVYTFPKYFGSICFGAGNQI